MGGQGGAALARGDPRLALRAGFVLRRLVLGLRRLRRRRASPPNVNLLLILKYLDTHNTRSVPPQVLSLGRGRSVGWLAKNASGS